MPMEVPKGKEPLIVSIKADGNYYLNLGDGDKKTLSLEVISEQVARIKQVRPDVLVLIEGDERVSYGKVVAVMASLQSVGVSDVGLMTDPRELK